MCYLKQFTAYASNIEQYPQNWVVSSFKGMTFKHVIFIYPRLFAPCDYGKFKIGLHTQIINVIFVVTANKSITFSFSDNKYSSTEFKPLMYIFYLLILQSVTTIIFCIKCQTNRVEGVHKPN